MAGKKKKTFEYDLPDLRQRRQQRRRRERRIKWLLTLAAILIIIVIAIIFRRIALRQIGGGFRAPLENPTYWFEQTSESIFSTITPTITMTPTATVPTSTPTPTATWTPTISPTPTLTPTPKLRPRKTMDGNAADLLVQAESTLAAKHLRGNAGSGQVSDTWFELLGSPTSFDAAEVYPNSDCSWMGVAGMLTDKRGDPQIGYYVQVGFADGSLSETLSGLFPGYGDSGYEITLARPVQAFDKPVWIQILDSERRQASEKVYIRPSSDCAKSLTLINFQRIK